ncbi:hypothetical protein ACLB2K_056566 [Fragaria x ananassa]
MNDEGKQLVELNRRSWDGNKGVKEEDQGLVKGDKLKSSGRAEDVKVSNGGVVQPQFVMQQPQGSAVCWERFLHLRSLKVLLVEYDDCTRHVVAALLRNCSYEVIEAANGIQAWKVLEDLTNHVDLILTEVVMPCVSGIGLLSKIMSHKSRKNVPVIMMSSQDSMGVVFKCLSKGAVDFLVKPIRKNELKNLWQHVWRRCHSSSGSGTGSESGTQTQKSGRSNSVDKCDNNNSGSNDEEDDGSMGLNAGDGSDNGSGTQSSWTKQAVEVDSPRQVFSWHPDSTCAQVVHSNAETFGNQLVTATAARECQQQKEEHDNFAMGEDLEIGISSKRDVQSEHATELPTKLAGPRKKNLLKIGGVTNSSDPQLDRTKFEASDRHNKVSDISNTPNNDTDELPSLELSLKRLRGVKGTETTVQDDRNVLRRLDSSAFSRYNSASNANKAPSGHVGSNSPPDDIGESTNKDLFNDIPSHSSYNPPNQCSNGGSNNIDMGSTTNNNPPESLDISKSAAASTVQRLHPSSAFHPVKKDPMNATQPVLIDNANNATVPAQSRCAQTPQFQTQNLHQDYDHHQVHHPVAQTMQKQQLHDHSDLSLKKLAAAAPHCGSSNVRSGPVKGNPGNYSVNRSASGSNHGSNGQNGSNIGGTNMESDNGVAGKSGSGDGSGNQSGNRVDENKFSRREAALTKFRQKRNERCFRKKVRYQSRKKLAEQRPRVRGQFVRQTVSENTSRTTDS